MNTNLTRIGLLLLSVASLGFPLTPTAFAGSPNDHPKAPSHHRRSGIVGLVEIGPVSPVIRPGIPNSQPFATTIAVFTEQGRFIAEIASDNNGRFRVHLKPGKYVLVPHGAGSSHPPYPTEDSIPVVVERKQFTPV